MKNEQCAKASGAWDREAIEALGLSTNWKDHIVGGLEKARGEQEVDLHFPRGGQQVTIEHAADSAGTGVLQVSGCWWGSPVNGFIALTLGGEYDATDDVVTCIDRVAGVLGLSPDQIGDWMDEAEPWEDTYDRGRTVAELKEALVKADSLDHLPPAEVLASMKSWLLVWQDHQGYKLVVVFDDGVYRAGWGGGVEHDDPEVDPHAWSGTAYEYAKEQGIDIGLWTWSFLDNY